MGRDARALDRPVRHPRSRRPRRAGPQAPVPRAGLRARRLSLSAARRRRARRHPCRRPPARRPRHGPRLLRRRAQPAAGGALSRASAQPAASATTGSSSPRKRSSDRRPAPAAPLFPAAIAALRTIRFAPDPLDRRAGEDRAEAGIVEREQVGQRRRGQLGAGQEGPVGARGVGEAVPRADREAIVAAVDAVADRRAEFLRDRPLMLDGEVGDAAPRIELERRRKGVGRAGVEAGACSCRSASRAASSGVELERRVDRAEEQPAAVARG